MNIKDAELSNMINILIGKVCKNVDSNAELAKKIMFLTNMAFITKKKVGPRYQTFLLKILEIF